MRVLVAILLVSTWRASALRVPPEVMANVSLLLAHHHHVNCLQIFRTDDLPLSRVNTIYSLWKNLAVVDSGVTTGIYSYGRYLQRKLGTRRKVSCYRSLKVMSDDEGSSREYARFSAQISIKDAVWVLFTDSLAVGFFEQAHVVFNDVIIIAQIMAEDMILFHEVYRVKDELPLKVLFLGNWTRAEGLALQERSIYDRRSDLEGVVLRVSSVENWPASYRRRDGEWDGFLLKLWDEIRTLLNCSSAYVKGENLVGIRLENGSWNGLVGMTLRDEIDVIVAEVIIDKERSRALNFLHPIVKSRFQIYTRHMGYEWQWAAILRPLGASVWAAVFGWVVVGTVAWAFFQQACFSYGLEGAEWERSGPMRSFFLVTQALCQQGYHLLPSSYGCRVLFFVSYAVSSVLIPSYSASVVSSLSQKVQLKSFDSLNEMVVDGSYRLLLKENTAQHTFFAHSKNEFFQLAYEKLVKPVPKEMKQLSLRESIKTLCRLDRYAVMGIEEIVEGRLQHISGLDCPIVHLTHPVSTVYLTMATAKNNPFWGLINHHLGKLLMTGIAERIKRLEFPLGQVQPQDSRLEVDMPQVASAFIFMACCALASLLLLLLEIHHVLFTARGDRLRRKKRGPNLNLPQQHLRLELKLRQCVPAAHRTPALFH